MCSESLRAGEHAGHHLQLPGDNPQYRFWLDYRALLQRWSAAFGWEALVVRLFERDCFVQGDLLHDAVEAFALSWDERFTLPPHGNESLNLLEMELLRVLNDLLPGATYNAQGSPKARLYEVLHRHLGALDAPALSFVPPQAVVQAWREWAAEGSEWVRQKFFPDRTALFAPAPGQPENYELTRMTPGCWEALGRALAVLSSENFRLRQQLQLARHDLQELRGGGAEAAAGAHHHLRLMVTTGTPGGSLPPTDEEEEAAPAPRPAARLQDKRRSAQTRVLHVIHRFQPFAARPFNRHLQGNVGEPAVRGCTQPVLDLGGDVDHVTLIELSGLLLPLLIEAAAGGDIQHLP